MNETNNNPARRVVMRRAERSRCRMQADAMQQHCCAAVAQRAFPVTAGRQAPPGVAAGGDCGDLPSDRRRTGAEPLLFVSARATDGLARTAALPGHDAARRPRAARLDPGPAAMGQQAFARVWTITVRPILAFPTPFAPNALAPERTSEADDRALPLRRTALTAGHRAENLAGSGWLRWAEAGSSRQVAPARRQARAA